MAKGRNVRVWNEDLCRALKTRQEQCQRQGRQQQHLWREGHQKIEAVRKDIYKFSTGRIVNLPTGLKKTVQTLCEDIINEKEPILPEGYIPTNAAGAEEGNPYDRDPYLKKIKGRGGAFAILMAFHHSSTKTLTKSEIIREGQRYCDDEMDSNFHAGRMYGAFDGVKTLVKHGLVIRSNTASMTAHGWRSDGAHTFTLTGDGEKFIEALLRKFPEDTSSVASAQKATGSAMATGPLFQSGSALDAFRTAAAARQPIMKRSQTSRKRNHLMVQDEQELRAWLMSARVSEQQVFKVGKARRQHLHDLCDNLQLENPGLVLRHESSDGPSSSRTLYVTIMAKDGNILKTPSSSPKNYSHAKRATPFASPSSASEGRNIKSEASPSKRSRCAAAVLERFGTQPTTTKTLEHKKPSAKRQLFSPSSKSKTSGQKPTIDLLSSDSESEDVVPLSSRRQLDLKTDEVIDIEGDESQEYRTEDVIVLDASQDETTVGDQQNSTMSRRPKLTILVDSRERNRNATPRHLRIQLENNLKSGALRSIWPVNVLPLAETEERSLSYGDFAFAVGNPYNEKRLGVVVERKRVADLVQRSVSGDHWKQLARMRDCCGVCVLLIENDTRAAECFTAYGAADRDEYEEAFNPWDTTIQDEDRVFLMMGRALLSSKSIKFMQTRDEQASLRAIGALGLVAAAAETVDDTAPSSAPSSQEEQSNLVTRLEGGGVPVQIARRVAEEIGSIAQLQRLYGECTNSECRSALLTPLLSNVVIGDGLQSTDQGWSEAVYRVHSSNVEKAAVNRRAMDEYKHLVEDHGRFLSALYTEPSPEAALEAVLKQTPEVEDGTQPGSDKKMSPQCDSSDDDDDAILSYVPFARKKSKPATPPHSTETSIDPNSRIVTVELSREQLGEYFPEFNQDPVVGSSPFRFKVQEKSPLGLVIPTIVMRTTSGRLASSRLFIHILQAQAAVNLVVDTLKDAGSSTDHVTIARSVAAMINSQCHNDRIMRSGRDRRVILLCGLQPALDAVAKKPGAPPLLKILVDLVLAELTVHHDVVVIQAIRLSGDVQLILKQMLFSCLYYHLLIDRA